MSWSWCRPAGECDVVVPRLVSAHWWAELGLRVSGSRGPGVGVGLLVGGSGPDRWLQGPRNPVAGAVVGRVRSCVLWWTELCLLASGTSGAPKAASLLVGGAMYPPS